MTRQATSNCCNVVEMEAIRSRGPYSTLCGTAPYHRWHGNWYPALDQRVEVNRAWKHPQECRDEAALLRRQRHFLMGARVRNPALAHIQTGPRRRRSRPQRGTRGQGVFRFQGREDDRHGRSAPCPVSLKSTPCSMLPSATAFQKSASLAKGQPSIWTSATRTRKISKESPAQIFAKAKESPTTRRAGTSF